MLSKGLRLAFREATRRSTGRAASCIMAETYADDKVLLYPTGLNMQYVANILQKIMPEKQREIYGPSKTYASLWNHLKLDYKIMSTEDYASDSAVNALKSQLHLLTCIHKSADGNINKIAACKYLIAGQSPVGGASQKGICLATDVRCESLTQAQLGTLNTGMVFACVDNSLINLNTKSAYMFGEGGRTVKPQDFDCERLDIKPYAKYTTKDGLEVIDPEAFVEFAVLPLAMSIEFERMALLDTFGVIHQYAPDAVIDKTGNRYSPKNLETMSPRQLTDILESTLRGLAKAHDKDYDAVNGARLKAEISKIQDSVLDRQNALDSIFRACKNNKALSEAIENHSGIKLFLEQTTSVQITQERNNNALGNSN